MTNTQSIDLTKLEVLDVITMGKGGRIAPVGYGKELARFKLDNARVVFEPTSYTGEEGGRMNLVLQPDALGREQLEQLDEWMVANLAKNSQQITGKYMTLSEVKAMYIPCLKSSGKYEPTCKLKVTMSGPNAVRVWDADRKQCILPETWRGLMTTTSVRLRGVYIMNRTFGCILEATDAMITGEGAQSAPSCPF